MTTLQSLPPCDLYSVTHYRLFNLVAESLINFVSGSNSAFTSSGFSPFLRHPNPTTLLLSISQLAGSIARTCWPRKVASPTCPHAHNGSTSGDFPKLGLCPAPPPRHRREKGFIAAHMSNVMMPIFFVVLATRGIHVPGASKSTCWHGVVKCFWKKHKGLNVRTQAKYTA